MIRYTTREEWLNAVAELARPIFAAAGHELPARVRISIGFPSTGRRGRRIGECWDAGASADGTFEIFIRPDQHDPEMVAGILFHELTHAAAGLDAGHGPKFRKAALAIGLAGKMKSALPGDALAARIRAELLPVVGALPHAKLDGAKSSGPKKQTTRLIKCECASCGYTVRVARKWIDELGAPVCPADDHGQMIAELPAEEGEPEEGVELDLAA